MGKESRRVKTKEMLLLQDVWRQAYRRGDAGMSVSFPSKAGAIRARMQLYNAVKLQRSGQDMMDMELVNAAEQLEIVWEGEQTLRLQRRAKSDMMVGLQQALGKGLEDYVDPDAQASRERLLKELEKQGLAGGASAEQAQEPDAQPARANPFFDRSKN